MTKFNDCQLAKLEQKADIIISHVANDVFFAIDRHGKGMYLLYGGKDIPIAAEYVEPFLQEAWEIWQLHGKKVG